MKSVQLAFSWAHINSKMFNLPFRDTFRVISIGLLGANVKCSICLFSGTCKVLKCVWGTSSAKQNPRSSCRI